jgi:hypothetical protein
MFNRLSKKAPSRQSAEGRLVFDLSKKLNRETASRTLEDYFCHQLNVPRFSRTNTRCAVEVANGVTDQAEVICRGACTISE